jgi:holo-[acyl-carrier protein] synthase
MEIVGLGTAIVECVRIRELIHRHGEQFLQRAYTEEEIRDCQLHRQSTERFASRWAAKEAVWKCLGGARRPTGFTEVEITFPKRGRPKVKLQGVAQEQADSRLIAEILLSIAHTRNYATATAIVLAPTPASP